MEHNTLSEGNLEASTFTQYNWVDIRNWVKTNFQVHLSEGINLQFSEHNDTTVHKLIHIIGLINGKFSWYNSLEASIQDTLTETLKALRTCVVNEDIAKYVVNLPIFYMEMKTLMKCIFTKKNGQQLCTKYLLQLFLNLLSVGSEEQRRDAREKIRNNFYDFFKQHFINEYGYIYETSAILYNVLKDIDIIDEELIDYIITCHGDPQKTNEFLDFLMEKIILSEFMWKVYEDLNTETRLVLLRCLREVLISSNPESSVIKINILPTSCVECFTNKFNKSASVVFQVAEAGCTCASQEVSYIAELLSHISSDERILPYLQNNTDLFINAGVLLLNLHRLGQMSNNIFTPIQKLAQNEGLNREPRNPVFGFKADLVRLIGNMCWKNQRMQDLARQAEIIPVLLDCCNIDATNPFIIQWVILAIRNILENNIENQAIIASLTQQGIIDPGILRQHGLILHAEEDLTVGIVGLNLNK